MRKKTLSMISIAAVTFICAFAIGGCGSGNSGDIIDSAVEKAKNDPRSLEAIKKEMKSAGL